VLLDNGEFPVVLGGDCSLLLGAMLALRRRGRYGVLYVDGDADFYQPEASPLRGTASASDLAFATGRGPGIVCDLEGRRPLVRDGDVAVLGCRDAASRDRRGCQPLPGDMLVFVLQQHPLPLDCLQQPLVLCVQRRHITGHTRRPGRISTPALHRSRPSVSNTTRRVGRQRPQPCDRTRFARDFQLHWPGYGSSSHSGSVIVPTCQSLRKMA
jgi:hypothetical protein